MRAPSNSNIQPWHLVLASGPARDRLVEALLEVAAVESPSVPVLPEAFAHMRRDLGALVYGSMGIARHDSEGRRIAVLRNWEFFRAPLAGIVCMHRDLDYVDALGVGMFMQTLLLALTARGLGTCVQVSIAGYPEIVREQLNIRRGHADPVWSRDRLPGSGVPRQRDSGAAQSRRSQRGVRRQLDPERARLLHTPSVMPSLCTLAGNSNRLDSRSCAIRPTGVSKQTRTLALK